MLWLFHYRYNCNTTYLCYKGLIDALVERKIDYEIIFPDYCQPEGMDYGYYFKDINCNYHNLDFEKWKKAPIVKGPDITKNIFYIGYHIDLVEELKFQPGYFRGLNKEDSYVELMKHYGENALNITPLYFDTYENIKLKEDNVFIKVNRCVKGFNNYVRGHIVTKQEFFSWKYTIDSYNDTFQKEAELVVYPKQQVLDTYRFYIADGKVITQAKYKNDETKKFITHFVNSKVVDFANYMASIYSPARLFSMDVVSTPEGYKVSEVHNFNSAAIPGTNLGNLVDKIESMV